MCSWLETPTTRRAAEFWTRWSGRTVASGMTSDYGSNGRGFTKQYKLVPVKVGSKQATTQHTRGRGLAASAGVWLGALSR